MKNLAKKITMQYKTVGLTKFFLSVEIANFCFRSLFCCKHLLRKIYHTLFMYFLLFIKTFIYIAVEEKK